METRKKIGDTAIFFLNATFIPGMYFLGDSEENIKHIYNKPEL